MQVVEFPASKLVHPAEEIADFVYRLAERLTQYRGVERRSEHRYRVAIPLLAMPLDDELKSAGREFAAVTRDISSRGIAMLHLRPVESPFLAVELTDPDGHKLEAAIEVLRCRKVDHFYEIAGKFVTKMYGSPE
jgi:hypothetical protein